MRNLRLIELATTVRFITIAFVIAFVIGAWMLLFGLFVQAVKPGALTQDIPSHLALR